MPCFLPFFGSPFPPAACHLAHVFVQVSFASAAEAVMAAANPNTAAITINFFIILFLRFLVLLWRDNPRTVPRQLRSTRDNSLRLDWPTLHIFCHPPATGGLTP